MTTTWCVACHVVVRVLHGYDVKEVVVRDEEDAEHRVDDVVDRAHDGDDARRRPTRWRSPLASPDGGVGILDELQEVRCAR